MKPAEEPIFCLANIMRLVVSVKNVNTGIGKLLNVFDEIHEIRDGSGIGVFAPQFGPRRAYFVGLSQKF